MSEERGRERSDEPWEPPTRLAMEMAPLADAFEQPAVVFDTEGTVHALNDAAESLLGVHRSFLVGKGVELTNSMYVSKLTREDRSRALFDRRRVWTGSWCKVHASGQEVATAAKVIPLAGTACYLELLTPLCADSDPGDLENRLMAALVDAAPAGLVVLDGRNRIMYANPAFEAMAHRGKRVEPGSPMAGYFKTADYLRLFAGGSKHGGSANESAELIVPEGRSRPVRVAIHDLGDTSGMPHLRLASFEDRTEAEGAREDAALLLEASRHMAEVLLFCDPGGSVFFVNEAGSSLFGLDEETAVGIPIDRLLGSGCLDRALALKGAGSLSAKIDADGKAQVRRVEVFPISGRSGQQVAWGFLVSAPARRRQPRLVKPADRTTEQSG